MLVDAKACELGACATNMLAVVEFISSALEEFSMHVTDLLFSCIGCTVIVEDYDTM